MPRTALVSRLLFLQNNDRFSGIHYNLKIEAS